MATPKVAADRSVYLHWNGVTGGIYQIESAESLGSGDSPTINWTVRETACASKGTNAEWMDVGDPQQIPRIFHPVFDPYRFYRVRQVDQAVLSPQAVSVKLYQNNSLLPSGTNQIGGGLDIKVGVSITDTNQQLSAVKVFVDGQRLHEDSSTNFTLSINTTEWPNGTHEIYAVATTVNMGDIGDTTPWDNSLTVTNSVKLGVGVSASRFCIFSNYISQFFVATPFFEANQVQQILANFEEDSYWRVTVADYQNNAVRQFTGQGLVAYAAWDGTDQSGNPLSYGIYDYYIEARPSQYGQLSSGLRNNGQVPSSLQSSNLAAPYRKTTADSHFNRTNTTVVETLSIPSLNPTNSSGTQTNAGGGSPPVMGASQVSSAAVDDASETTEWYPKSLSEAIAAGRSSYFVSLPPMPPMRIMVDGVPTIVSDTSPNLIEVSIPTSIQNSRLRSVASQNSTVMVMSASQSSSWPDATYTTRTPTRVPGSLFFGFAGTVGVGYQGHHPTKSQAGTFGNAPGGVLASTPPWGPLKTASTLANGFSQDMGYAGWRTSFLLGDDNLNSLDLMPTQGAGSGTGTFATKCNFGLLIGHMTASSRTDPNYFATVPYYPVYNSLQPGRYQWLALPSMDFGNGSVYSKLRWMGLYGCQSLKQRDYSDLWTKFLLPMPPNLRLILGSEDGVFIHPAFGPRFAADLNGWTSQDGTPMNIFDSWCDAATDTDTKMSHSGWWKVIGIGTRRMTAIYRDTTQGGSWNTLSDSIWNWNTDVSLDWYDVSFTTRQVYQ